MAWGTLVYFGKGPGQTAQPPRHLQFATIDSSVDRRLFYKFLTQLAIDFGDWSRPVSAILFPRVLVFAGIMLWSLRLPFGLYYLSRRHSHVALFVSHLRPAGCRWLAMGSLIAMPRRRPLSGLVI